MQNFGSVDKGRLEKAVNVLAYTKTHSDLGFFILRPERNRHFATNELMAVLLNMGRYTKKNLPGHTLAIGDISAAKGGKISGHASHQMGVDMDVVYFFKDAPKPKLFKRAYWRNAKGEGVKDPDFMIQEQWKFLKHIVSLQWTDRIFVHPNIKLAFCKIAEKSGELKDDKGEFGPIETLRRLRPEMNHGDHFHLRTKMRCNKDDRRCQPMAAPESGTGCDKIKVS
ncbi:Penicillin-insensitive murein endopeptidase precursor [compost metagenome]